MRVHVSECVETFVSDHRLPDRVELRSVTRSIDVGGRWEHITTVFDPPIEFREDDDVGALIAARERELAGE